MEKATQEKKDLNRADLREADLDHCCMPLWCGGQQAKISNTLAKQFLAHALAFNCEDEEYQKIKVLAKDFCTESHVAKHIEWLHN